MAVFELRLDQLHIEGVSRAGDGTWFRVQPPGLVFDTGRGALQLTGADFVFISHGHLDHALGLPFVLSHRTVHALARTRVFCPTAVAASIEDFVRAAAVMEEAEYDYEIRGLQSGDRVPVGRDLTVEAFAVEHGVPALGFHLMRGRKRLLPEHSGRPGGELAELRRQGVEIEETREEVWVTYCGDTGAGVFTLEPRLFEATVLLLECTFLAPEERGKASEYQHLHLTDLERHASRFSNQAIVLHHLTRRYSPSDLRRAVDQRLPRLADRIHVAG